MDFKKGDIVTVNLNAKKGHEVGKVRPAVIISGDDENNILDTIILIKILFKRLKYLLLVQFIILGI